MGKSHFPRKQGDSARQHDNQVRASVSSQCDPVRTWSYGERILVVDCTMNFMMLKWWLTKWNCLFGGVEFWVTNSETMVIQPAWEVRTLLSNLDMYNQHGTLQNNPQTTRQGWQDACSMSSNKQEHLFAQDQEDANNAHQHRCCTWRVFLTIESHSTQASIIYIYIYIYLNTYVRPDFSTLEWTWIDWLVRTYVRMYFQWLSI